MDFFVPIMRNLERKVEASFRSYLMMQRRRTSTKTSLKKNVPIY